MYSVTIMLMCVALPCVISLWKTCDEACCGEKNFDVIEIVPIIGDFGLAINFSYESDYRLPQVGFPCWLSSACLRECQFGNVLCELIARCDADSDIQPRTQNFPRRPPHFLKLSIASVEVEKMENPEEHQPFVPPEAPPVPPPHKFKLHTNHFVHVMNAVNVKKVRMIMLRIVFRPTTHIPQRDEEEFHVMVPLTDIERGGLKAVDAIKEKLRHQTNYQLFVYNPTKYCRDLLGKVQYFEEVERGLGEAEKFVFSLEKPSVFEYENKCYFYCGELWNLSDDPVTLADIEQMPFMVDYSGERKNYELNEKRFIETIVGLVRNFNQMQPNEANHGFPIAYLSRHFQCALYPVLVRKYNQPVTFCSSGKKNGKALTGCGKSLMSVQCQQMTTGEERRGGTFKEKLVFDQLKAGEPVFCDETHLTQRDTAQGMTNIITGQFQCLERMIGAGGAPSATIIFHANKPPSSLKLKDEILARVVWIYAGAEPLKPIPGIGFKTLHRKMVAEAKSSHDFLPNILSIAYDCFSQIIPDNINDEMFEFLGEDSQHLSQEFYNLEKFHAKIQSLIRKHNIGDVPPSLQRDVDFRPFQEVELDQKDEESVAKTTEDFLSALENVGMEDNSELSTWKNGGKKLHGIKIWIKGMKRTPLWAQHFAKSLPTSTDKRGRFRFLELERGVRHSFVTELQSTVEADSCSESDRDDEADSDSSISDSCEPDDTHTQLFTVNDDIKIISFVTKHNNFQHLKNPSFWQHLEKNVVKDKTWQQTRKRFFDVIVLKLDEFTGLDEDKLDKVRGALKEFPPKKVTEVPSQNTELPSQNTEVPSQNGIGPEVPEVPTSSGTLTKVPPKNGSGTGPQVPEVPTRSGTVTKVPPKNGSGTGPEVPVVPTRSGTGTKVTPKNGSGTGPEVPVLPARSGTGTKVPPKNGSGTEAPSKEDTANNGNKDASKKGKRKAAKSGNCGDEHSAERKRQNVQGSSVVANIVGGKHVFSCETCAKQFYSKRGLTTHQMAHKIV